LTNSHSLSFFGQNSGIILTSSSREELFVYLKFIKKKHDELWEKPSQKEGISLKLSMEELIMISRLLEKKSKSWSMVHAFNNFKTQISFNWDQSKTKEDEK